MSTHREHWFVHAQTVAGGRAAHSWTCAVTLHGLRHTAATLLLRDGRPVNLVAKQLGHKDISVTLNTYSHALPQDDAVLGDALERIVSD